MKQATRRVAVILSGSGVFDGAEITESVATLVHLSRREAVVQCFAPDVGQLHAVNHLTGQEYPHNRNVLQESARIARGNIKALSEINVNNFDAIMFPGGFGAAKNLSNWANEGIKATLNEDVKNTILKAHEAKIPIGACCIAPTLLALALHNKNIKITVGNDNNNNNKWPYSGTVQQLQALGVQHIITNINEICIDEKNKLVTAPAYMYEGKSHEIFDNIEKLIEQLLKM